MGSVSLGCTPERTYIVCAVLSIPHIVESFSCFAGERTQCPDGSWLGAARVKDKRRFGSLGTAYVSLVLITSVLVSSWPNCLSLLLYFISRHLSRWAD